MKKDENKPPKTNITISVRPNEYRAIYRAFCNSGFITLGRYAKSVLLKKPVAVFYRSKSLDELITTMNQIKNEMRSASEVFGDLKDRLHTMGPNSEMSSWGTILNKMYQIHLTKMEEIRVLMIKNYELCLQKSIGSPT